MSDSLSSPATAQGIAPPRRPAVRRLILGDFRSYATLDLHIDADVVVLTGDNGAGKTNVLEALSFLSPGRGLRRAEPSECARVSGKGGWAVSAEVADGGNRTQLGTGLDVGAPDGGRVRRYRLDRAPATSATAFAEWVRVVWLTPAMDGLFVGPAAERRRFLDRLVLALDPAHGARVNALERALRNRNRLLEMGTADGAWLDAAEQEVVDLGVAVAAARNECVARLAALIAAERDDTSPFAWAALSLEGEIEALVAARPAIEAEDHYRAALRANRVRDAAAGRTLIGPHVGDLAVRHGPKDIEAVRASTGEQKALLVGLVLAHAKLVAAMSGMAPIILLDEVTAHFDRKRRAALFVLLRRIGAQVWATGADEAAFEDLGGDCRRLRVAPGCVLET